MDLAKRITGPRQQLVGELRVIMENTQIPAPSGVCDLSRLKYVEFDLGSRESRSDLVQESDDLLRSPTASTRPLVVSPISGDFRCLRLYNTLV